METELYYSIHKTPTYEIPSRWFQTNDVIFDKIKQQYEHNKWRKKTRIYKSNKRR